MSYRDQIQPKKPANRTESGLSETIFFPVHAFFVITSIFSVVVSAYFVSELILPYWFDYTGLKFKVDSG